MADRCTDPGRHTWEPRAPEGVDDDPLWWCATCDAPGRPTVTAGGVAIGAAVGSVRYALAPDSVAADLARRFGKLKVEAETLRRERDEALQRAADLANEVMVLRDQLINAGLEVKP